MYKLKDMAKDCDAFDCLKIIIYKDKRYSYFSKHETEKENLKCPCCFGCLLGVSSILLLHFLQEIHGVCNNVQACGSPLKSLPLFHVAERIDQLPCFLQPMA